MPDVTEIRADEIFQRMTTDIEKLEDRLKRAEMAVKRATMDAETIAEVLGKLRDQRESLCKLMGFYREAGASYDAEWGDAYTHDPAFDGEVEA